MDAVTSEKEFRENVGDNLQRHLDARGMSIRELARQSGLSPSNLGRIVRKEIEAGGFALMRIAETLDLSMDKLTERRVLSSARS